MSLDVDKQVRVHGSLGIFQHNGQDNSIREFKNHSFSFYIFLQNQPLHKCSPLVSTFLHETNHFINALKP